MLLDSLICHCFHGFVPENAKIYELSVDRNEASGALPPQQDLGETATRILEAGLDLFAARGYHATSIREIAAGAALQSASLYTHFASKEAILAELQLIGHQVHNRALMSALLAGGADPRDQLHRVISAHVTAHCRWPKLAAVSIRELASLSEQAAAPALALRQSSTNLLVEIIDRGMEQMVFSIEHREVTLSAIGSLGTAVINWYPAEAATYTPEQVGTIYADLTLRMVGASL